MKSFALAAVAALAFSTPALAGLDGTSATVTYNFPDLGTVYGGGNPSVSPFVIGAGVESVVDVEGVTFISIDFTDLGLTLTFNTVLNAPTWNESAFNGLVFTGPGFPTITGLTILGGSTFGAGNPGQLNFSLVDDQLRLDWGGVQYNNGEVLNLGFSNLHGDPIPEPATWAMLILGFGTVGATLRRRNTAIA